MELPLDQPSWTFHLLGESGESDPYLLKRSGLAIHAENHHYRRFQRESQPGETIDDQRPIVFCLDRDHVYNHFEPRVEESEFSQIRAQITRMDSKVGIRLINVYFDYVYPYFPVLSYSKMIEDGLPDERVLQALPLSLKAALYASALPYMVYDDVLSTMLDIDLPTAKELYRMSWVAITQEIHSPRLSTLQSWFSLPVELYGVDRESGSNSGIINRLLDSMGMPLWEKKLRKRLWWGTFVLDKWNYACSGLASHIHKDDYDVLPLDDSDVAYSEMPGTTQNSHVQGHFCHLVELTIILSDMIDSFFTIRASKRTSRDFSLTSALANELRSRLDVWKTAFDKLSFFQPANLSSRVQMDGSASLGLAYWAVHLLIMRAILRSLETRPGSVEERRIREEFSVSVRLKAESYCIEFVEFTDRLQAGAWNAFWHKCKTSGA
ncbi:hypothetical protein N7450_007356 [Penicillium hetheringtonii]|uniref:Xylanolytic transcriptional activator regulatory domain-containing protein n=1 Tax=Penicillium hetheringtonii TaxID=911720 RepID=A0AAD6DHC6_9EURO|nr:hypothetical protein N7450_007356 [Penicillium hetheringtonii]